MDKGTMRVRMWAVEDAAIAWALACQRLRDAGIAFSATSLDEHKALTDARAALLEATE